MENNVGSKFNLIEMLGIDDLIKEAYKAGYQQRAIDEFHSTINGTPLDHYNDDDVKELSNQYVNNIKEYIQNKP